MSDSYDDYESKMQLAEHAWEIKEARHTFRKNRIKENKMSREVMKQALEALESMLESIHPYREDGTPTIPDATIELVNAAIAAIEAKLREKNQ